MSASDATNLFSNNSASQADTNDFDDPYGFDPYATESTPAVQPKKSKVEKKGVRSNRGTARRDMPIQLGQAEAFTAYGQVGAHSYTISLYMYINNISIRESNHVDISLCESNMYIIEISNRS